MAEFDVRSFLAVALLLAGCAAPEAPGEAPSADPDEVALERRLGSAVWNRMSPEQRECHLRYFRAGDPAQVGDERCKSLL